MQVGAGGERVTRTRLRLPEVRTAVLEEIPDALDLAAHAEAYRIEYNTVRPHEAIARNRPIEVHLGHPASGIHSTSMALVERSRAAGPTTSAMPPGPTTTRGNVQELKALTSLRFFAAFYVFAFHIHIRWPITSHHWLASILSQGAVGMSIFFTLSGYVLAYRYDGDRFDAREYFDNRFAKIYPVYIVAGVITLPWLVLPGGTNPLWPDWMQATLQLIIVVGAAIFLLQAWLTPLFSVWNFGASWSISVEAFLYATFPLLVRRIHALTLRRLLIAISGAYLIALAPGAVIAAFAPTGVGPIAGFYSMPIFRLGEFALGMCAYQLSRLVKMRAIALDIGVIALWAATFTYLAKAGAALPLYIVHDWILLPAIFFTLIALGGRTMLSKILSIAPLPWLGRVSYCFYSFQVLVILLMTTYHDALISVFPAARKGLVFGGVAFTLLLLLSAAGYTWIEEPLRKRIRARLRSRRAVGRFKPDPSST